MRKDVLIGIPVAGLLTYIYMLVADFAVVIPLRFNESLYPNAPWLFLVPLAGLVFLCFQWPFVRWSAWPILALQPPRRPVLYLVLLAIPICIIAGLIPGGIADLVVQSLPLKDSDTGAFAVLLPVVMPLWAAINEEIGMRGILQGRLQRHMPMWLAIGITTCVFVWLHYGTSWFYAEIPFYIALSLTSGLIAARSRSVLPSIALHLSVNALGTMLPLVAGSVRLRNMPDLLVLALLIVFAISVYLYRRVMRSIPQEFEPPNELIAAAGTSDLVKSDASSAST